MFRGTFIDQNVGVSLEKAQQEKICQRLRSEILELKRSGYSLENVTNLAKEIYDSIEGRYGKGRKGMKDYDMPIHYQILEMFFFEMIYIVGTFVEGDFLKMAGGILLAGAVSFGIHYITKPKIL